MQRSGIVKCYKVYKRGSGGAKARYIRSIGEALGGDTMLQLIKEATNVDLVTEEHMEKEAAEADAAIEEWCYGGMMVFEKKQRVVILDSEETSGMGGWEAIVIGIDLPEIIVKLANNSDIKIVDVRSLRRLDSA
jgi:hypothetical protein